MKHIAFAAISALLLTGCARQNTTADTTAGTATSTMVESSTATTATTQTTSTTSSQENSMATGQDQVAVLHTTEGDITIRFFPDVAPNHVNNFLTLAKSGFYNGTKFHRIIPGFMIQGGDPNTKTDNTSEWGMGGSGKNVNAEFNSISHKRGIVSMARSNNPNSASSQFFIVVKDSTFLDRQYTVFGQVTNGMDVADKIVNAQRDQSNDRPYKPVAITSIDIRPATADEKALPKP